MSISCARRHGIQRLKVRFLTDQPGTKIVRNVVGKMIASALELEYRYAEPYIATRRHNEDLAEPLRRAASAILQEQAALPRSAKIELVEKRAVQDRVLESICRATVGDRVACPLKMRLSPQKEAMAPGATWSPYYSEKEAIEEKHLPTLLKLLTQPDSPLVHRDEVFALLLEIAEDDVAPLSQVAQQSHLLDDDQFDRLIGRILAAPGCGNEAVAIISKANRLTPEQRLALRAKALGEASIATVLAHAMPLRLSDPDIAQLAARMRSGFHGRPGRRGARAGGLRGAIADRHPARCRHGDRQGEDIVCAGCAAARQFFRRAATRSHEQGSCRCASR